jgi:hypothetical protein
MPEPTFTITEEKLTPEEWAAIEVRRDHFLRNAKWFEDHAVEIGQKHRGKHVVVAGQELFVGDTFREARDRAAAAHPDDRGVYFEYIPVEQGPRIYAHLRHLEG